MKTDVELEREILEALRGGDEMHRSHIGVTVKEGVAWLRGTSPNAEEQWEAESVAANVQGVKRVVNHLEVVAPSRR
jgi:osmotically-inducible protein OsmY